MGWTTKVSKSSLARMKNKGLDKCKRCGKQLEVGDIVRANRSFRSGKVLSYHCIGHIVWH